MNINLPDPQHSRVCPNLAHSLEGATQVKVAGGEFQISRLQLTDGTSQGVELLMVDSGSVRAAICPTRGMSLWKSHIDGNDIGWQSPVAGPVHPSWVPLDDPNGLGWLAGFDELLVRCGLRNFGAPEFGPQGQLAFPLHGRIGNLPARAVAIEADPQHSLLHVRGEVHETRFLQYNLQLQVVYTFAIGDSRIAIHDRVTNAGATPTSMQLLYHINIGAPLLEAGARLYLGADKVVARNARAAEDLAQWHTYQAPTAGYAEQVYFSAPASDASGWAKCLLAAASGNRGVAVHYRPENLPFFSQWKNTVAETDGYVTGLEPGTGFPNPRSFEEQNGRVVALAAGESKEFRLAIEGISSSQRLAALQQEIASVNGGREPATSDFQPNWCVAES